MIKILPQFIGTEWEGMSEEDIFVSNYKLIKSTIANKFKNHQNFCKLHMIDSDDLIQLGSLGLLRAIRTYKNDNRSEFVSYAINQIAYSIQSGSKKVSLRSINTQTFDVVDTVLTSQKIDEEGLTIGDVIQASSQTNQTENFVEDKVLIEQLKLYLTQIHKNEGDIIDIFMRMVAGKNIPAIAKELGCHRNNVRQRLKTRKAKAIKQSILDFIKEEGISECQN